LWSVQGMREAGSLGCRRIQPPSRLANTNQMLLVFASWGSLNESSSLSLLLCLERPCHSACIGPFLRLPTRLRRRYLRGNLIRNVATFWNVPVVSDGKDFLVSLVRTYTLVHTGDTTSKPQCYLVPPNFGLPSSQPRGTRSRVPLCTCRLGNMNLSLSSPYLIVRPGCSNT